MRPISHAVIDPPAAVAAGTSLVAVAPSRKQLGFDGSERKVKSAYEVLDLREALLRVYPTDAHLVTYVVRGATRQPRINKCGLASFPGVVETHAFFCDVDNAGHAPWTPALAEEATLRGPRADGPHHSRAAPGRRGSHRGGEQQRAPRARPGARRVSEAFDQLLTRRPVSSVTEAGAYREHVRQIVQRGRRELGEGVVA